MKASDFSEVRNFMDELNRVDRMLRIIDTGSPYTNKIQVDNIEIHNYPEEIKTALLTVRTKVQKRLIELGVTDV